MDAEVTTPRARLARHIFGAGLAAITILAATTPAGAAGFETTVSTRFEGSMKGANQTSDERFDRTITRTGPPGQSVSSDQNHFETRNGASAAANARGNAGAGRVGAAVSGEAVARLPDSSGDIKATVTSTVKDTMTVRPTQAAPVGTRVRVENRLKLSGTGDVEVLGSLPPANDPNVVSSGAGILLQVFGTGIGKGPRGDDIFATTTEGCNMGIGCVRNVLEQPDTILFSMEFIVGIPTELNLTMILTGFGSSINFDRRFGKDGFGRFVADYSHTLEWGDLTTFRDVVTGELLDGVSVVADSGFDYAHPGDVSAAVPEPSTWALLIGGFGLAGAHLRRRRPAAA